MGRALLDNGLVDFLSGPLQGLDKIAIGIVFTVVAARGLSDVVRDSFQDDAARGLPLLSTPDTVSDEHERSDALFLDRQMLNGGKAGHSHVQAAAQLRDHEMILILRPDEPRMRDAEGVELVVARGTTLGAGKAWGLGELKAGRGLCHWSLRQIEIAGRAVKMSATSIGNRTLGIRSSPWRIACLQRSVYKSVARGM